MDYETKMDIKIMSPLRYLVNIFDEHKGGLDKKVVDCNAEIKSVEMFEKRLRNKKQDMRDYIHKYKTEMQSVFIRLKEKVDNFLNYNVNTRAILTMKFAREKIGDKFKREVFGYANPKVELDRIINDSVEYIDRNNNVLWDMAHNYIESEIDLKPQPVNDASQMRKERYFASHGTDKYANLKDYTKQFQELDGEIEGERIHKVIQSGFINFIILEGLAIGIIISLSTFLSFIIPGVFGVTVAIILAGVGLAIYPIKRKKYRNEFVKRIDAICERFNNLMMFEFEKVVDRVIEDIGNKMSAYRDTRWSEREEFNRQINDLKSLSERTKDLMRKCNHK
jgi:hypothetical protein